MDSQNLYAFNRFDSINFRDPLGLASGGFTETGEHGARMDIVKIRHLDYDQIEQWSNDYQRGNWERFYGRGELHFRFVIRD